MQTIEYAMQVGSLNQIYDKVKNCKITKPSYEADGNYSSEFFLDKREGLTLDFTKAGVEVYDSYSIGAIEYFLVKDTGKLYIGYNNAGALTYITDGVTADENSPQRIVTGRTASGPASSTGLAITSPTAGMGDGAFSGDLEGYAGGYVKFQTTPLPAQGDYVTFTSGILTGATNKVQLVDDGYAFIIGTNARGSIPSTGSTLNIYNDTGKGFLIGHTTGVSLYILDGTNQTTKIDLITTTKPIVDLVNHDGNIFALTEDHLYFTRSTFDDNTQFYALDNFNIDLGYKLFSMGKTLLTFARTNKLFASASTTQNTMGYVGYDINYNGDLFSKYSTIFTDNSINILQQDNQLMQVDVTSNNSTTYDLRVQNIMTGNRGLFEDLSGGEVNITSNDRFLNVIHTDGTDSTNYQYDKQNKHWIINEYVGKKITNIGDKILGTDSVYIEGGDTDNGTIFNQEINFGLYGGRTMYMPYVIRTVFGIKDMITPMNLKLDMEFEIGGKLDIVTKELKNFNFDERLTGESQYDGTTVSLQRDIHKTGRYIRFKFYSEDRFILGPSYVFAETTKPMVNEFL